MPNQILFNGCAPEPLIHYLKALGVFRLVAEQCDAQVRGSWRGDAFMLETERSRDALVDFFLSDYCPTPLVTPWNNGSGFHGTKEASGSGKKVANFLNIKRSTNPRLKRYRDTIRRAEELLSVCLTPEFAALSSTKRSEALKPSLIRLCRNHLDDETVRWLDAVCLLVDSDDLRFPPLLGSGGNDGNLEFSLTFMGRLHDVLPTDDRVRPNSKLQLEATLFATAGATGVEFSPGQFHPGGSGGVNATSGINPNDAKYLANPWDYILAVEGVLFFAGAAVRRLAAGSKKEASFPFCVKRSNFGSTAAPNEESRGEIFLPLWERSVCFSEIDYLFTEGRVRLDNRRVQTTIDFARAIAELGIDRGITRFRRHALFTRNGNMQFATALGDIEIPKQQRPSAALIYQVDRWLDSLRRATSDAKRTPPRFIRACAKAEEAIFDLCAQGHPEHLRATLIALGAAEADLARSPRFRDDKQLKPLAGLTERWAGECDDRSHEYEIAVAVASLTGEGKRGTFRTHLEPVEVVGGNADWTNDETGVVWSAGDLSDNLAAVLHRRSIEARAAGASHPALSSARCASLAAVDLFLRGEIDDDQIESLLRGLMLIKWRRSAAEKLRKSELVPPTLPRAYALLKLLFLPEGRLALRRDNEELIIRHEPSIVPLLRAGRIPEALEVAERRLRSSGLVPLTSQFHFPPEKGTRLAAALLVPISRHAIEALAALVLRPASTEISVSRANEVE